MVSLIDISRALVELSLMFNVDIKDIIQMRCRKSNIMDARRFLIYYLHNNKGVKHFHMKQYIKRKCGIKGIHHATSLYHCRVTNNLFDIEEKYRRKYFEFIYKIDYA